MCLLSGTFFLVFRSCYIIRVTIISHFLTLVKKADVAEVPINPVNKKEMPPGKRSASAGWHFLSSRLLTVSLL